MERYKYSGPVYYYGNKIGTRTLFTMAPTRARARHNILFKLGDYNPIEAYRYDIVDNYLVVAPVKPVEDKIQTIIDTPHRERCKQCGYELNDAGDCPVCDYGEYDLLEAMHQLKAIDE